MKGLVTAARHRISNEPVLVLAAVEAVLGVALVFGLDWTAEQAGAVLVAVGAVLALAARQRVTPS